MLRSIASVWRRRTSIIAVLLTKLLRREFGSDLLAGMSIVTSVLLGEYLAGSIVVLMLAGGEALESYALRSAGRMRSIALHSAVGGTLLSIAGMLVAASGHLSPVEGAISQEVIDVACGGEGSASF
jgi:cation transport ATPase